MIIDIPIYNGDTIHSRFAYRYFNKGVSPYGDIVCFRAPMFVSDNLIDLEDSMTKDYIFSEDAINFCWEIPHLDAFGAVAFQRLFNTAIANILSAHIKKPIEVRGDDLMVHDNFLGSDNEFHKVGKVSVSITYSKDGTALGHTGINVVAGPKAPGFAYSSNLVNCDTFMEEVAGCFRDMTRDIFVATTKILV